MYVNLLDTNAGMGREVVRFGRHASLPLFQIQLLSWREQHKLHLPRESQRRCLNSIEAVFASEAQLFD